MKYSLEHLKTEVRNGKEFEFVFFWGHEGSKKIGTHCLSQWYESNFTVNNILYKTAEHWMMYRKAMQFDDFACANKILTSETPKEAKGLGRKVRHCDYDVWYLPSYAIVVLGNIHKFNQHPDLLDYLLAQRNKILVEASPYDTKWGVGLSVKDKAIFNVENWKGTNFLGFALMEVIDFFSEFGTFEYLQNYLFRPCDYFKNYNVNSAFWMKRSTQEYQSEFEEYYEGLSKRDKVIFDICNPQKDSITPYNLT